MPELKNWVVNELNSLLQYNVSEDLADCILMIESNRDLEEYLSTLLDITNQAHLNFMKELMQRKQNSNVIGYKKTQLDNYIQSKPPDRKKKNNKSNKTDFLTKKEEEKDLSSDNTCPKTEKKKSRPVNLFTSDSLDVVLLKGRHVCNCQASKHKLVNNCLKCGRIVCEQEGPGPCFFCHNPISRMGDNETTCASDSAVELKDRLLEYDKSCEKRTKVIDDENDYFSSDSVWLSKEQKEELKKKEEELQNLKHSRKSAKLFLDFTGRFVVQSDFSNVLNLEESFVDEVADLLNNSTQLRERDDLDPNSTCDIKPIYCEEKSKSQMGSKWHNNIGRVQDKQVMEMSDQGVCLSMHQPWASLLVSGIKQHEGRSWYTSHRGRLWIASTAKIPSPEDVEQVLCIYRALRGGDIRFPKKFPNGVLLGCVTVSDCLAQEDYREKYPDGESDEPFVFICEDPIICPIMFPLKGQHKIYKLDVKIHQAAVKCIQKMSKLK